MWDLIVSVPDHCLSFYFAHIMYIKKTEISMVAGSCCSSIRTFHIWLSQNWKTTRNQSG